MRRVSSDLTSGIPWRPDGSETPIEAVSEVVQSCAGDAVWWWSRFKWRAVEGVW